MSFEIHSLIVSFIKYVFRTYCRAPDPKNVYILIFRICEYVRLHGKGEFRLHLELRLLIKWPWDEKVILEYLLKDNVITRVFISGRGGGRERTRKMAAWESLDPKLWALMIDEWSYMSSNAMALRRRQGNRFYSRMSGRDATLVMTPWF